MSEEAIHSAVDVRGVQRSKCRACPDCPGYQRYLSDAREDNSKCLNCKCPPGKHKRITASGEDSQPHIDHTDTTSGKSALAETAYIPPKCRFCNDDCFFDINRRLQHPCCQFHLSYMQDQDYDDSHDSISASISIISSQAPGIQSTSDSSIINVKDPSLCAIEDCNNPRHKDESGKVHDCCGFTHAMELSRRKAMERMKQPVVKGISHCFLPNCNSLAWPFMNYCSKSHAIEGKRQGLKPPVQFGSTSGVISKDPSLCSLPECQRPKFSEGDKVYDFCGRTHAQQAKERGLEIMPAGDSGPKLDSMCRLDECRKPRWKSPDGALLDYCCKDHADKAATNIALAESKDESMCIIPECSRPKYVNPETKKKSYYCSKSHVREGQKRGIEPILKSWYEVDSFLKSFGTALNVVDVKENDHAKPGGALYKKFVAARNSLPVTCRKTCLAFHGTADSNISSICTNGYDKSKRNIQAHGPGEYFATTPGTSKGYVRGGKRILLNELLLGQSGIHHTKTGDIIVMKNPAHDLPRYIITFQ